VIVGGVYPGAYWLETAPVPVIPGFAPCLISTIKVRTLVVACAALDCTTLVEATMVQVQQMATGIEINGHTITATAMVKIRYLITSEGMKTCCVERVL